MARMHLKRLGLIAGATLMSAMLAACNTDNSTVTSGQSAQNQQQPNDPTPTDPVADLSKVPFAPTPDADTFFAQPAPFPDVAPGTILKSREVKLTLFGGLPVPHKAWQLQFATRDVRGHALAAVTTVVLPDAANADTPLLSLQYASDSLGAQCEPSHALTGGTANTVSQAEGAKLLEALRRGWAVAVPDHQGPYSAYEAGRLQGQITLDGIRAALAFKPMGLKPQTPVGMMGYSGGSHPSLWAASFRKDYAPELNIVGVSAGGVAANVIEVARLTDTNPLNQPFFSLVFMAIEGINRAYPELVTPYLNDKGIQAFKAMKDGCAGGTTDNNPMSRPFGHLDDYTTVKDLLDGPSTKALAAQINLPQAGHAPDTDVFVYHAATDELLPVAGVDTMVDAWCQAGSKVHYFRGPVGEHLMFDVVIFPFAFDYMASRFAGGLPGFLPTTTSCN